MILFLPESVYSLTCFCELLKSILDGNIHSLSPYAIAACRIAF